MTEKQYRAFQIYFQSHPFLLRVTDFFATKVIDLYVLLPLFLLWSPLGRQVAYSIAIALVVCWGIFVQIFAYYFPYKRPYQAYQFQPAAGVGLFSRIDSHYDSFPSGHAAALAVITMLLFALSFPLGICSLIVVFLSGLARVLLGYHYIADVLGGILLATLVVATLHIVGLFPYIVANIA